MSLAIALAIGDVAICATDLRRRVKFAGTAEWAVTDSGGKLHRVPGGWAAGVGNTVLAGAAAKALQQVGLTDMEAAKQAVFEVYDRESPHLRDQFPEECGQLAKTRLCIVREASPPSAHVLHLACGWQPDDGPGSVMASYPADLAPGVEHEIYAAFHTSVMADLSMPGIVRSIAAFFGKGAALSTHVSPEFEVGLIHHTIDPRPLRFDPSWSTATDEQIFARFEIHSRTAV